MESHTYYFNNLTSFGRQDANKNVLTDTDTFNQGANMHTESSIPLFPVPDRDVRLLLNLSVPAVSTRERMKGRNIGAHSTTPLYTRRAAGGMNKCP